MLQISPIMLLGNGIATFHTSIYYAPLIPQLSLTLFGCRIIHGLIMLTTWWIYGCLQVEVSGQLLNKLVCYI